MTCLGFIKKNNMKILWNKEQEQGFFKKSLELTNPEKLFYNTKNNKLYAYWPKNYIGKKSTLQSRNSLIGNYSEKWSTDLFGQIAGKLNGYAIQGVVCDKIGLTNRSPADVAICKNKGINQNLKDILMIIEVKMSIVWNWELSQSNNNFELICRGDYKTHQGNPGLLRSDSMLKAIGKSINIRVSNFSASKIPIIILGNTPITKSYYDKVDQLKKNGIIQGFWSVNSNPLDNNDENIKQTKDKGFYRFDDYQELEKYSLNLLSEKREFFSSMQTKKHLGEIIEIANKQEAYEDKAQCFLELLRKT